jgi:hypothetical protein
MSESEHSSRAGRFAALATLALSIALFATALLGIAAIDPTADAAAPAPATRTISLDGQRHHARDCPLPDAAGDRSRSGVRS